MGFRILCTTVGFVASMWLPLDPSSSIPSATASGRLSNFGAWLGSPIYLHWPFGHALGEPGNVAQQRTVLHDMLSLAAVAPRPGLIVDLPYRWRRETYAEVRDWTTPSAAIAETLGVSAR